MGSACIKIDQSTIKINKNVSLSSILIKNVEIKEREKKSLANSKNPKNSNFDRNSFTPKKFAINNSHSPLREKHFLPSIGKVQYKDLSDTYSENEIYFSKENNKDEQLLNNYEENMIFSSNNNSNLSNKDESKLNCYQSYRLFFEQMKKKYR